MQSKKFTIGSLVVLMVMGTFISSCSKSGSGPTKTTPPVDTTKTYHDPAQYGTPYSGVPATKDIVMYEVNLETFTPVGFAGVDAYLDSIKSLGTNVIWLMPTYPVGVLKAIGSPYAVKDYEGVNASFGSLADMRKLVADAHNKGMAVIMDWVADHTAWDNSWISNKTWYKQDGSGNIISPPGFNDVAALNYNNTDMRTAMIRAMKYWIFTANVDGYRCDDADGVPSDFWAQALDTLSNIKTHKLIYLAEGALTAEITAGFQLSYGFDYYTQLSKTFKGTAAPSAVFTSNDLTEVLPIPGLKLRFSTNHDDASTDGSTIFVYKSKQGAEAAFSIAATMGGVPMIYSSQEVAYPNPINFFTDVAVDYTANPDVRAAYKQIIAFRTAHAAVKTGSIVKEYSDASSIAFEKTSGTDDIIVMANTTGTAATINLPATWQNTTWTNAVNNGTVALTTTYTIPAYGYLLLHK